LAATVSTAPIMWATFGEISVVGPFANVVVGPVVAVAFWASAAAAVLVAFSRELGWVAGIGAYYPLAFIHSVAAFSAELPFASVAPGRVPPTAAIAAGAMLGTVAAFAYRFVPPASPGRSSFERSRRMASRLVIAGACGAMGVAAIPVSLLPVDGPGQLRIDFLDVGQGDAILVTTPRGRQVLVDGGPSATRLAAQLGEAMPHWDRSLDAVVLTHPQEDHLGGLPGLASRMETGLIYTSGRQNRSFTFEVFRRRLPRVSTLSRGDAFVLDGVRFDVLWPPPDLETRELNDTSIVLMVSYRGVAVLLTGDIEAGVQRQLMQEGPLRANILKVPHHGSKTSDPAFLGDIGADVAVIQAAAGNRFGHPHDETLAALAGSRLYRTDQDGRVTVLTDGRSIRISTRK
jgi:competence protein ComEC